MTADALRKGTRLRLLRGHHPGSVCEVLEVRRHQVRLRGLSGAPAKQLREPFWMTAQFLLANAEVIR